MKKIAALILLVVAIGSCKDDPKPSVEQLLTDPVDGWVFDSVITIDGVTGQTKDLVRDPTIFIPCNLDDAIVFLADGTFKVPANIKCNPTDADIADSGTWVLSEDKTRLVVTSLARVTPILELESLTVTDTKITGETSYIGLIAVPAIVTLRKKGTF
jgi:hypothetical protein